MHNDVIKSKEISKLTNHFTVNSDDCFLFLYTVVSGFLCLVLWDTSSTNNERDLFQSDFRNFSTS